MSETLIGSLDKLMVSRIDPHEITKQYRQQALTRKGAQLDTQGRALLKEGLRSSCSEKIALMENQYGYGHLTVCKHFSVLVLGFDCSRTTLCRSALAEK
ncbi:hypothetical protein [Deefgea sp. CFH1-16]|uniref:hypothetical protein n=1 Tax=Deefgea sp. CFH1-16 TaxID=2675457 RepID=UPI00194022BE